MTLRFTSTASRLFSTILLAAAVAACQAPPKNFLQGDWSALATANPTDIAVARVTGDGLPKEVKLDDVREAVREELLLRRYSPLSFQYVDASTGGKLGDARVDIVIKRFETQRYEMNRSMRVIGEFLFRATTEGGADRLLANVNCDQVIDLSDESRQGVSLQDATRWASRKFVGIALQGMPDRRVDSK